LTNPLIDSDNNKRKLVDRLHEMNRSSEGNERGFNAKIAINGNKENAVWLARFLRK